MSRYQKGKTNRISAFVALANLRYINALNNNNKKKNYFSDSVLIQRYNAILLHDCFVKEEEE